MSETKRQGGRRFSLAARVLLTLACGSFLLLVVAAGAAAAAFQRAGSVAVDLQPETGGQLSLTVPAGLVHLAIALAPEELLGELGGELRPYLPAVAAGYRELSEASDFVMAEVRGTGHHVVIEKRDRLLAIRVDADGERVRIEIPFETLGRLLDRLDGSCRP